MKFLVLNFINQYKIKEYSEDTFCKCLEDMGYAVVCFDENQTQHILKHEENEKKYFLFDNGIVKYVGVSCFCGDDERCDVLLSAAVEIYLSQNVFSDRNVCVEDFEYELKCVLKEKGCKYHVYRYIYQYASVFAVLLLLAAFCLFAINLEKSMTKQVVMSEFDDNTVFTYVDEMSDKKADIKEMALEDFTHDDALAVSAFVVADVLENEIIREETSFLQYDETEQNEEYYVTSSGTKYHVKTCSYIKDLSKCTLIDINDAKDKYTPCKRCIK